MKKLILLATILLLSCNNSQSESNNDKEVRFLAQKSIQKLIEERHKLMVKEAGKRTGFKEEYLLNKYKDDAIKSLKINDSIIIDGTDLTSVFYSYNLGTDVHREHTFLRKIDGNYTIEPYISNYDDDPFKNGKPEQSKIIFEKINKWISE